MAGLLITSVTSGQIITRTGRYKPFPIAGTGVMVVGLLLLSGMNAGTSKLESSAYMFVLGLGLGLVMQVLVLAVQNAVSYEDLGVATSGATLFRSIGGSVGTAILGSIFASRLSSQLTVSLPRLGLPAATVHKVVSGGTGNPAALKKLPAPLHGAYIHAFTNALGGVFVVAAGTAAVAFLLSWALEQRPLRDSVGASAGIGESFAVPKDTDSLGEMSRALGMLIGREGRRQLVERVAERAGVDLSAAACWLLVRLHEDPLADIVALCEKFDIPGPVGERALAELESCGLVVAAADPTAAGRQTTPAGELVVDKLLAERRASLARLLDGWAPEQHADLTALLTRFARELAREPAAEVGAGARA